MTLETRRASAADLQQVLALARRALGWSDVSPRFLEWKHLENPFGRSLMWVACDDGHVVGFRAFLQWELVAPDGRVVRAARAVDTATDPDFRRQGLFRALTVDALDELTAAGIELVWNTPNPSSLPGYLTMGWREVGRVPVGVMPASSRFPFVVLTARRAAGRDAVATTFGRAASEVFGAEDDLDRILAAGPPIEGLGTRKSSAFLRWRYGNPALGYRVLAFDDDIPTSGLVVFRLRRRGKAVEGAVCELLVPAGPDRDRVASALLRRVARETSADYLMVVLPGSRVVNRPPGVTRRRFVRLPQTGPVLACRPLDGSPPPALGEWALTLGDVELL